MESLKIFHDFKFGDLDEKWILSIWNTEFTIFNDPPDKYIIFLESDDMRTLLHESCSTVKTWLTESKSPRNSKQESLEVSWNTLIVLDIKVQALLALLGYIMKCGQSKDADEDSRQSCLYATSLYFLLLAIPGSSAFNVFHPTLYQRAIETLKMSKYLLPLVRKHSKAISVDNLSTNEELLHDCTTLTSSEKISLMQNLYSIVCDFNIMMESFSFKDHVESLDITIQGLLELAKIDNDNTEYSLQSKRRNTLDISLSQCAYAALNELCHKKHGPVNITIILMAKYALPQLLCSHVDAQTKILASMREATICFLKSLLDAHEKDAKNAFTILAQHLMVQCPDRFDARQKQAAILVKLLNVCKQNVLIELLKNIILLSHHGKISCRTFAQEIIGKLLIESFSEHSQLTDVLKIRLKSIFFAIVLSRCMDCSNMVRGKAMAIVAEFTGSTTTLDRTILQNIFEKSDRDKEFSTFDQLNEGLLKTDDVLPGSNVLISMLTDRIEDERALIRRSTLQVYKNLALMFPVLIDRLVPAITRRCRDPTQTVRRFAIQIASQLLQQFPDNSILLEEWVKAVMPLIFDAEVKVQEKVLEYLQEMLLNEIRIASKCTDSKSNVLPWRILNKLTSMKMRKHLSKACSLWLKNGVITKSIITNIQSHIDTINNTPAWILLAALAENTTLPNLDKYVFNYKELLEQSDFHSNVVLQVLRYSWKSLNDEILKSLHEYLYERLQQFQINFSLISISLDIVNSIVRYLHPKNGSALMESNMLRLINISESEIKQVLKKKAIEEVTLHYLKVLFTLGHALLFCGAKISPPVLRILEGILLEWRTLPKTIKEIEQLQAFAVIILGQQAIRDHEIAQEVVPIFGRLMRQETDINSKTQIAVKINSAKALADVCVRFTALVEPYLSDMCVSMKDASPHVREAIMVIFIQLLLEDFIKVKGPFFFHVLTMLSDTDDTIRELTVFLIEERLLVKNKTLISQQFLESIYHYNDYQPMHKLLDRKMHEKEKKALTLPGKRNEEKRRTIYDFMLDHLDPPGKIKLLVKLTSQILAGTCEDAVDVEKEEGICVLKDALYVISNERLQPTSGNKYGEDQEQEESTAQPTTPTTSAINIIIDGMKKHGLDVLLPILMRLRNKLSSLKSPVENNVKRLLVKTYFDYNKEQLSNILNEYPKLEKEIEMYRRQLGSHSDNDNDNKEECNSSAFNGTPTKLNEAANLKICKFSPRVTLRRVSTSRASNRTDSPDLTFSTSVFPNTEHHSKPLAAKSPLHSPVKCGPSASTPKSHKYLNTDRIPGHVSKARKLSAFFHGVETSLNHADRSALKRSIVRKDSESD